MFGEGKMKFSKFLISLLAFMVTFTVSANAAKYAGEFLIWEWGLVRLHWAALT